MTFSAQRRSLLLAAMSAPLAACAMTPPRDESLARELARLESESGGRLGVAAYDLGRNIRLNYRGDERFAMCSTFKVLAASGILAREPGLLQTRIRYTKAELVAYSPVTEKHVAAGMTNAELCAAALQYSDNTAANLLMKQLGGPAGLTAYARSIGDEKFRIDRWETELNSAIPGDERDTTTPLAMMGSLQKLALGDALGAVQRTMLVDWMLGNTTGATRIRAGVPADWKVADKTGSGSYGVTNDIGIVWPPGNAPIVIAVFFKQPNKAANTRNDVVAAATRAVVSTLA